MPPVDGSSPDLSVTAAETSNSQQASSPASGETQHSDVSADSSTADKGVKGPASALEAVKAALEATRSANDGDGKAAESPPRDPDGKGSNDAKPGAEGEEQNLEDRSFSREANGRIRKLVAERNAARQELDTLKAESTTYRDRAEAYDTIVQRVRETGASAEQVDQAVQLLGLLNNNPAKAFEVLTPIYQQLEQFVGGRLPADLQEKVDGGYIDEASAQELARLRNTSHFVAQRHQTFVQQTERASSEQAINNLKGAVGKASEDWESNWRKNDPDYRQKVPFVMDAIRAEIAARGGVGSPQEAVEIAEQALSSVNERLRSVLPPKQEVRTVTGGHPSGNSAPKPRTALDAARMALRGAVA